ncbi:Coenzyme F420 hydrogenase/dehydrogenase, beta subunit C-terminal domain [Paucibacter sp. M5-1]|uniref:Coenzyme F420 hydrogenase/dehydrogenase, beta subunit C-terminal domain n=1 Tax=Paucibacter sp. M5-1 TaxID=3015998 RepID=UPI0022B90832|nr:Coenzyme F420 hydrogenase/dehydrogenase, beta subunit C-terminal domain [Paucibacter sp. M5-1]MCZ7879472.1 Coenzyme F420 hydrogenase/dehydrogenase, beta subunit C-terminal domain [Paucibacter sp. M5-1]
MLMSSAAASAATSPLAADKGIVPVIDGGFCVGCGACAVASEGRIRFSEDETYRRVPVIAQAKPEDLQRAARACPFSPTALDETEIARIVHAGATHQADEVGLYLSLSAGQVRDEATVMRSSSGGLTTWVLQRLLETGVIDGVVHVGPGDGAELFEYAVSHTTAELRAKRKSQYYNCDFSDVVAGLKGNGRRYAFVGVPCYVKAMRLLTLNDTQLAAQFTFFVALICGHMKTKAFAQLLAWQCGIAPEELARVDFRVKEGTSRSDDYRFAAWRKGSTEPVIRRTRELYGHNWGQAMFQLRACDHCDDIFGEAADICLGDAWLPRYVGDPKGTNVLVNRHPVLEQILREGAADGAIQLDDLSLADIVRSQEGNFRHRRDGLAVRQADAARRGQWTPPKRGFVSLAQVSFYRRMIVRLRRGLGEATHGAFAEARLSADLSIFTARTRRYVRAMEWIYKLPLLTRPGELARRVARKLRLV